MKKEIFTVIISLIAIAISIIIIILTIFLFNTSEGIANRLTLEGYIGIMAGFMGICSTFIVGLQIYNSVETKRVIDEEKRSWANEKAAMLSAKRYLELELSKIRKELEFDKFQRESTENRIKSDLLRAQGMTFLRSQPLTSFIFLHKFLVSQLKESESLGILDALDCIGQLADAFPRLGRADADTSLYISKDEMNEFEKLGYNSIKQYKSAALIETRYKNLYKRIFDSYIKLKPAIENYLLTEELIKDK